MTHFKKVCLFIIAFGLFVAEAQEDVDAKKLFKYGAFDAALIKYQDMYTINPNDVEVNYRLGFCYLMTNIDKSKSVKYLEFALEHGKKSNELIIELGEAYMHAHRFDDAIEKFNQYKNLEAKDQDKVGIADKFISFCVNAKEMTAKPLNVEFESLGSRVNSTQSDFFPAINREEDKLIFSTDRHYVADFVEFIHDLYFTEYRYGRWKRPRSVSSRINSTDNEYLVGATPNLEFLIIRPDTYESSGDLYYVEAGKRGRYGLPVKFPEPINLEKTYESSGCLSPSGDTLYFSSDREGGLGGSDIYYSLRIGENWGVPQNLGPTINTPYDDEYPRISFDGGILTFASEGHKSMGGFDLFTCKINPKTREFTKPQNFGYPINTTYDDFSIALAEGGRYGYVAQVREDGLGKYDLYKVIFEDIEPVYVSYSGIVASGDTASYSLFSKLGIEVEMQVYDIETNEVFGKYKPNNKNGKYIVALPPGKFELIVSAPGHLDYKKTIKVEEKIPETKYLKLDVFLKKR